jgi:hypothetical protein
VIYIDFSAGITAWVAEQVVEEATVARRAEEEAIVQSTALVSLSKGKEKECREHLPLLLADLLPLASEVDS